MAHTIKWLDNNPIITFTESPDFNEVNKVNNFFIGNVKFDLMKFQIWNFNKCSSLNLTEENINYIEYLDKSSSRWRKRLKVALISNNPQIINTCQLYIKAMKNAEWKVRLFEKEDKALNWCRSLDFN